MKLFTLSPAPVSQPARVPTLHAARRTPGAWKQKWQRVAILTVRDALEAIAEDEARQSYEQRNRELLAAELAKRGEWAKDPIGTRPAAVVQPALWPAAPAVWHSTDKLNAELVQRAVATIVLRIEAERADLAARGLEEQFDAELKAALAAKCP